MPIMTSTSAGSQPQYSTTPLPLLPSAPIEWASSTHRYAPYFFLISMIGGSRQMLPSMLYRPSTRITIFFQGLYAS